MVQKLDSFKQSLSQVGIWRQEKPNDALMFHGCFSKIWNPPILESLYGTDQDIRWGWGPSLLVLPDRSTKECPVLANAQMSKCPISTNRQPFKSRSPTGNTKCPHCCLWNVSLEKWLSRSGVITQNFNFEFQWMRGWVHDQNGVEVARTKKISGVGCKFCSLFSLCLRFELVSTGFTLPLQILLPLHLTSL